MAPTPVTLEPRALSDWPNIETLNELPEYDPDVPVLDQFRWWTRGQTLIRPIADGRFVGIHPLLFTHAIVIGQRDASWWDDRWCYETAYAAMAALTVWAWDGALTSPEPTGWHRHPFTGRRCPGGDPDQEHVDP